MIFAYFAQVWSFGTKKWSPTKHCCILHGIGGNAATDQRECGIWIVGLLVFTLLLPNSRPKLCVFAYFALVRTFETKKLGPTKHRCILHGNGSTAATDQRECGIWIVGIFVSPFASK